MKMCIPFVPRAWVNGQFDRKKKDCSFTGSKFSPVKQGDFPCQSSGGAMMLCKLPVPGRPTNMDHSRARAYCACSRCGWGGLDIFSLVYHFSYLFLSLWETARYRLKYCLKGPLSPKQPTNHQPRQPFHSMF